MKLMGDPDEFAVNERPFDGLAGIGEGRYFEHNFVANPQADAGDYDVPIEPFYGDILSSRTDVDGMPFLLECVDPFQRINADSALRAAVVLLVVLGVTNDT